jgi:FkbM family methyltransferase
MSRLFERVYAFEINDELTGWIRDYNPGNIEIIHCGLSSSVGTARFYVPVMNGRALPGWGSLDRGNLAAATEHREKDVKVARLDDFGIGGVGFVKIDVEGHEVEVLKGAAATIGSSRPIVLIEVRDRNLPAVESWFQDLEYERRSLSDLTPAAASPGNYIYIPSERLPGFGMERTCQTSE